MAKVIDFQEAKDRLKSRSVKHKIKSKMKKVSSSFDTNDKIIIVGGICMAAGILIGAIIASKK